MLLSGRRPKPDVGNPNRSTSACAFTVAGWTCAHATRPRIRRPSLRFGVSMPRFPAFTGSAAVLGCAPRHLQGHRVISESRGRGLARSRPAPTTCHRVQNQVSAPAADCDREVQDHRRIWLVCGRLLALHVTIARASIVGILATTVRIRPARLGADQKRFADRRGIARRADDCARGSTPRAEIFSYSRTSRMVLLGMVLSPARVSPAPRLRSGGTKHPAPLCQATMLPLPNAFDWEPEHNRIGKRVAASSDYGRRLSDPCQSIPEMLVRPHVTTSPHPQQRARNRHLLTIGPEPVAKPRRAYPTKRYR